MTVMLSLGSHRHKWSPSQNGEVTAHLGGREGQEAGEGRGKNQTPLKATRPALIHQLPESWKQPSEWSLSTGQMGKLRLLRTAQKPDQAPKRTPNLQAFAWKQPLCSGAPEHPDKGRKRILQKIPPLPRVLLTTDREIQVSSFSSLVLCMLPPPPPYCRRGARQPARALMGRLR